MEKTNREAGKWKWQNKVWKREVLEQESLHKAHLSGNWGKKGKRGESLFCGGGYFD